jgi:rhomboid protease GluP
VTQKRPETAEASRNPETVTGIRDGTIDFARYSSEQLQELRYTLNQSAFPLNYANLLAEIERRASQPPATESPLPEAPPAIPAAIHPVRFTPHDGLRGWLEAKSRRLALYSEGFLEIRAQEIVLGGWQRTWLGVAQRTQIFIPLEAITDVIQGDGRSSEHPREGDWVRFRYESLMGPYQFVEFQTASVQQAAAFVDALPRTRSAAYEQWTAVREFDARLRELGSTPWITNALVIANVAAFALLALILHTFNLGSVPQLLTWGVNFAPLTLHGQWWRLLSALFLHANPPHVLFNMWALWNIGRITERLYGNWVFAFLYFACGVLSGLASIVWDPTLATLGASGAIFGIFAAFVVFALHPHHRVAVKVPTALWVSTSIFALYNLIAGFFTPGIDNAAHVGGVLSGLALGACLARPLTPLARSRFPVKRAALAATLTALGVIAALWEATGFGDPLTVPERYLRTHLWYISGEAENLRQWEKVLTDADSGQLSHEAVAERFEREIVPFWQTASGRLKKEENTLPPDERQYAALFVEYARLRLESAHATLDAIRGDQERASDVAQHEKDSNLIVGQIQRISLLASLGRRPHALAESPWIVAVKNLITAQRWKCVEPPPLFGKLPDPKDSPSDGPTVRQAAGCRAQKLFVTGEYLALDQWIQHSAAALQDLPDGGSTFDGIVRGLSDLFDYRVSGVIQTLRRTADWQRRAPRSVYPKLIQSLMFESWAWSARGHGPASSISPQTWALFAQRTEMAAVGLRELGQLQGAANDNPLWYELSLDVGLDESKTPDELRRIFDRGVVEQPHYWPLYTRMLRILMPRWGGSQNDIHKFVMDVSVTLDGQRDFEKYAKLYWSYSWLEDDDAQLFGGSLATWSVVNEGFEELRQRYPHSDFILNAHAKFACMADDADVYRDLRPQLRGHISSTAWSDKVSLQSCDKRFPATAASPPK